MKTKFVDCFGHELKVGDDILVSFGNLYDKVPTIYCGMINKINKEYLQLTWQQWNSDETVESTYSHIIYKENDGINKLRNIYKVR